MKTAQRERGWSAARALRARERLAAGRPVDVEHVARSFGARVVRGDLDGAMARIIGHGSRAVIRLSNRVLQVGAQRFSVAHELGHLVMQHPTPNPLVLAARTAVRPADRGVETEANAFAAELLMPEAEIHVRLARTRLDLELARAIATDMGVSVVAAALRCVELTTEPSAIVLVEGDRVTWIATGGGLRTGCRRGMRIDPGSLVAHLAASDALSCAAIRVPARLWRIRDVAEHLVVHEQAVRVPEQAAVLSLVTASNRGDRAA
jgi:hypothetical protein